MSPEEFFAWIEPVAVPICKSYGLPPSVLMAQAALESGWGQYKIGEYNLFGRKWNGTGNYIEVETQECIDGDWQIVVAKFQDYSCLDEAVEDWCILLTQEPCYATVNDHLDSIEDFVRTLGPVYATDPKYADKVLATIRANDLEKFDE